MTPQLSLWTCRRDVLNNCFTFFEPHELDVHVRLAASARHSGSATAALNAARKALARSSGTPGGATKGRAITPGDETSSIISLCCGGFARSSANGTSGRFALFNPICTRKLTFRSPPGRTFVAFRYLMALCSSRADRPPPADNIDSLPGYVIFSRMMTFAPASLARPISFCFGAVGIAGAFGRNSSACAKSIREPFSAHCIE
jgi:hypothetical protein